MRFAFGLRPDGLFFVMAESSTELLEGTKTCSWLMTYVDEDEFLRRVVHADLAQKDEQSLLVAVVVGVSRSPATSLEWVNVDLTLEQMEKLALNAGEIVCPVTEAPRPHEPASDFDPSRSPVCTR